MILNNGQMPSSSRTKELAKKLGLIKRASDLVSCKDSSKKRKVQIFSHIIVLDYEATCWKGKKGKQEIIEFPCVLIDIDAGKITDEFQQYVQPQENTRLSSFCTELTGITQEQVDGGVPLPTCLMLFNKWIKRVEEERGFKMAIPGHDYTGSDDNLCVIATWTDWDLEVCLKYECQRKRIKKLAYFNHWIDLRATYKTFYDRKPAGLNGALKDLGIEFKGREHCGLHDARNTATLCIRLMEDGCQLNITKSIHALTETSSSRSCQLPQPVLALPQQSVDEHGYTSPHNNSSGKRRRNHFSENDSFNIPTEAWLDISIPNDVSVMLDTPTSKLPKRVTIADSMADNTSKRSLDSTPSLCKSSINNIEELIKHSGQVQTPHSIISPFTTRNDFSKRQTSTPILPHQNVTTSSRQSISITNSIINNNTSSSLFKTPSIISNCSSRELINTPRTLSMTSCSLTGKVTPPLCKCGKRTKRKLVSTEGANEGRPFYCCCMSRLKGCGFFEWESSVLRKYSDYTPELLTSDYCN